MVYLLQHTIERSAERFPDKDAFRCGSRALTYGELNQRGNQLSFVLRESGVRRGDRVGIFLNRCLETAISIFGILKAGATYVPLDPYAPPARIRFLLHDCGIRHLVTSPAQRKGLDHILSGEEADLRLIIGIENAERAGAISWEEVANAPAGKDGEVRTLEQDLAYILYTSGTTGTPKGIMHTHYSGLSYAKLSAGLYDLHPGDVVGNHAPIHFDISTFGYFSAPLAGATTVIVPEAYIKMPASLSQLMEKEQLTVWYSVPLALIQLLQRGALDQRDLNCLRWVLFAGEPFPTKHLRALMQQWPQAKYSNIYGPTELNQCTFYHVETIPETDDPISIGKPWDNTEMLITDEKDQPLEQGETGELLVRSATIMKGYWGRPELTEKAFFKRTVVPDCEEIFYRTGDLVRLEDDGNLTFLGRKDRQVKTRGYRVELDEITTHLLAHQAVEEAAVYTIADEDQNVLIEAMVILKDRQAADENELRDHLGRFLPWYYLPNKIAITNTFPRTSTGKIDHTLLREQANKLLKP